MLPQPDRALTARISALGSCLYKDCREPWPVQTRRFCLDLITTATTTIMTQALNMGLERR